MPFPELFWLSFPLGGGAGAGGMKKFITEAGFPLKSRGRPGGLLLSFF
jgi:hypothetical protein